MIGTPQVKMITAMTINDRSSETFSKTEAVRLMQIGWQLSFIKF